MDKDFRRTIAEAIQANRPNLGESSLKTYVSILSNLLKRLLPVLGGNEKEVDSSSLVSYFNTHVDSILDYLKDTPPKTRKSILSALFVLTNNDTYRKHMIDDCKVVNDEYKNQTKDDKQRENWISMEDINKKYESALATVEKIFKKTMVGNTATIVNFLLLAFLGGCAGLPPRRSLDYTELKIRNYNPKTDNYYKAGKLYFNRYKTANKYGLQILDVPSALNTIIKKWIKINTTDYMLFSTNENKLTSPQVSRMLNKIFDGKNISVDMLRHIYLSNVYKDVPALKDMERLASDMSHSVATAMTYVKRD